MPPGRYELAWLNNQPPLFGKGSSVLTVHEDGDSWELDNGATLDDVTHRPCRSARYQPLEPDASPAKARLSDFPVTPGAEMPSVPGCAKQDYAVLFVIGLP